MEKKIFTTYVSMVGELLLLYYISIKNKQKKCVRVIMDAYKRGYPTGH